MKRTRQYQSDGGEGVVGRRASTRQRKKIRYFDDENKEENLEVEESKEKEDQKKNEQQGPSIQNTNNQGGEQRNRFLLVSCGDKKGILSVEKLSRAEECIQSEGRWFYPTAFETFSGRRARKKWKQSILCEGKPLQNFFECGILSTNGFQGRRTNISKPKKIPLNPEPESSSEASEEKPAEEIEEDDDRLPASEERVVEAEEEEKVKEVVENGGETADSKDEQGNEGEDKTKRRVEDGPGVHDSDKDNNDFEEMETPLTISKLRDNTLHSAVVVLERIRELERIKSQCQTLSIDDSDDDSWCKPLDEYMQSGKEKQHSSSATDDPCIAAAMQDDSRQISEDKSNINVKCKRDGSDERQDGQTEIPNEKGNSVRPLSAPTASSDPGIVHRPENIGPINSSTDTRKEKEDGVPETEQYVKRKDLPDMSTSSEVSSQPPANVNISDATANTITPEQVAEESIEPMNHSAKPLSYANATAYRHDAAQAQVINKEARVPNTTKASDTDSSGMEEGLSSKRSMSINLDTMDLDQLMREKMKMQIKVLQLQQEYYAMKIQEFQK